MGGCMDGYEWVGMASIEWNGLGWNEMERNAMECNAWDWTTT